jgi:hypothetical protein
MQSVTSISFLGLAYAKYLSHASQVLQCGSVETTPAKIRAVAKRQVSATSALINLSGFCSEIVNIYESISEEGFK